MDKRNSLGIVKYYTYRHTLYLITCFSLSANNKLSLNIHFELLMDFYIVLYFNCDFLFLILSYCLIFFFFFTQKELPATAGKEEQTTKEKLNHAKQEPSGEGTYNIN